jgi:predicted SnoaL-like aldol condensation-catalyzing enzyme
MKNKDIATNFLKMIIDGKIDEAYQVYIDPTGKHHNMFTPSGFENLKSGMQAAEEKTPNKHFAIKNVFGDDDLIAVHSHLVMNPPEAGMATVHMFKFNEGKIIEMWDIAQQIPEDPVNNDGAF